MHRHIPDMLSVEEARGRILALVPILKPEERPLLETLGQVLAKDIAATFDIPPWDNSAMDGYAVQLHDLHGANQGTPTILRVIGTVAAGQWPQEQVRPGTAIRIMTGAPIPSGADAVVPFEDTDEMERKTQSRSQEEVAILNEPRPGAHVRHAAEDVRQGDIVLSKGTILKPSHIGVLASLGYATAQVVRRPQVAILSTGDELLPSGEPLQPGKIYDSNSHSLAALVLRCGGVPRVIGIAQDNLDSLNRTLDDGLSADMLITSAGVSKGDYDMVKDVLAERGEIAIWSVRMRPAKPLAFGLLRAKGGRSVPHLGLPGNPVSAMVAFEELGRPALLKMMGRTTLSRPAIEAILEDPIVNEDGRRVYARAIVTKRNGTYYARLTGPQGSNILTSMTRANGLAICPEDIPVMKKGQRVQVEMLDWDEEVVY